MIGWAEWNFFRDNIVHVFFPEEVTGGGGTEQPDRVPIFRCHRARIRINGVDNCNLIVEFSEPICETLAETPKEKDDNPHFTIDGSDYTLQRLDGRI